MDFSYREVIAILAEVHEIDELNMTAFRGRIQHMQRLGFPSGVNTGKGRPAHYSWRELLLLALAFQYLEVGSTPDRSVAEIVKFEDRLLIGLSHVILARRTVGDMDELNCFLCAELSSLLTLKIEDEWHQQCHILSLREINKILSAEGSNAFRSPYAIIDLRQFIGAVVNGIISVCGLDNPIVAKDIKLWAGRQNYVDDLIEHELVVGVD